MKIPHSSTMQRDFDVSMTPMIDVVFLLLIFFVCTASFQIAESVLPTPLSSAGTTTALPPEEVELPLERVLINVTADDRGIRLAVNGQDCPTLQQLSTLLDSLARVDRTLPVILDVAGDVQVGATINVYDRCRLAGFEELQFAAEVSR